MSATTQRIVEGLMALSPGERLERANALYESVDDKTDPEVERAWNAEIDRRLDEYEADKAVVLTEAEANARVRKVLDEARRATATSHA
jgi:putative addiction module component (TIGR02574 family)